MKKVGKSEWYTNGLEEVKVLKLLYQEQKENLRIFQSYIYINWTLPDNKKGLTISTGINIEKEDSTWKRCIFSLLKKRYM